MDICVIGGYGGIEDVLEGVEHVTELGICA